MSEFDEMIYELYKDLPEEEFFGLIKDAYGEELTGRRFSLNAEKLAKLGEIIGFFAEMSEWSDDGEVEPVQFLMPGSSGDVIARFRYFTVGGSDMKRFSEIIAYCSSFDVQTVDGMLVLTLTVPGVLEAE